MANAVLQDIDLAALSSHDRNPRLSLRVDVIEGIVAGLKQGFLKEHALRVRPLNGGYQIISGHHRVEAAKRAGIETVPCWVRDLSDDEAFMELVKSNNQGELTPLEIGLHALQAVPKAQGKAGAGLAAYADELGKGKSK